MIWMKRNSLLPQTLTLLLTKGSISIPAKAKRRYWPLPCLFWELLDLGIQVGSDAITQKWRQYLQSAYILQESSGKCHRLISTELPYQSHSVGGNQLEEMDSPQKINLEQLMSAKPTAATTVVISDLTWIKIQCVSCSENWNHILLWLRPLAALPLLSASQYKKLSMLVFWNQCLLVTYLIGVRTAWNTKPECIQQWHSRKHHWQEITN